MKKTWTIALCASCVVLGMVQNSQAILATDNLADLIAGNGSIGIGDKVFSGFSTVESGLTSYDASQIQVTATVDANGVYYLSWGGNMSLANFGSSTVTADLKLNYIVTATAGVINMIDQSYTGNAHNGALSIDESVSATGIGAPPTVANSHLDLGDLSDPNVNAPFSDIGQNDNLIIDPAHNVLFVTKDIFFAAAGGTLQDPSFATVSEVTQSFHQTAVPEATTVIAASLLLLPFGASTLRIIRKNRAA